MNEIEVKQNEIQRLKKQIVLKMEAGEDYSELSRRRDAIRAEIAGLIEDEELKKIADERQALRDKAEAVKVKVQKQNEAIDAFLKVRDSIVSELLPILDKARELPGLQTTCYEQYRRAADLAWVTRLPEGYLSKDLTVPVLEGKDGIQDANDRAAQAVWYISAGLGLLQSLIRVDRPFPERPPSEFEAIEPETSEANCLVCQHPEAETINDLLKQGKPLRDIESQFDISRSTLSRHKNRCLNMGAIRVREDAI